MMNAITSITKNQKNYLLDIFQDTDNNINAITQTIFTINDNDGKSYFVEELRGKSVRFTKRDLLKDFKAVKILLVIRDNLMLYRTLLIDAYWALYDNFNDNVAKTDEILKNIEDIIHFNNVSNSKFAYDRMYNHYTQITFDERNFMETLTTIR